MNMHMLYICIFIYIHIYIQKYMAMYAYVFTCRRYMCIGVWKVEPAYTTAWFLFLQNICIVNAEKTNQTRDEKEPWQMAQIITWYNLVIVLCSPQILGEYTYEKMVAALVKLHVLSQRWLYVSRVWWYFCLQKILNNFNHVFRVIHK